MSYLDNYKAMAAGLVRGLRVFRNGYYGQRLIGTIGLYADLVAEGTRAAFISRLPGHPEQAEDSLAQVGADREMPRYRNEPTANYATRVRTAWAQYAQGGTNINLANQINYMLSCLWAPGGTFVGVSQLAQYFENGWAQHTTVLPFNPGLGSDTGAWSATPETYGAGFVLGATNRVWGASNFNIGDFNTIKQTIRKWLPSRTKGFLTWPLSIYYGQTGLTYGGGATYSATGVVFKVSVD
jgi:hypothetical protein